MRKLALIFFFIFSLLPFNTRPAIAAESTVVLNEIYPQGSPDWIEIYNPTSSEINVGGWKVLDTAPTDPTMKTIPDGTIISPFGFLVVGVSNRLTNSGDSVKLIDKNGAQKDSFSYNSSTTGKSFARNPDGTGNWLDGQTPTEGTSNGNNNPTPPPPSPSGNIILSEFMPDPAGGNEWAEVYNPESFEADIGGWKIDDIEGASSPYPIPPGTKISPGGFLVFSFSSKLNNSGDSIRLLNPSGGVAETYSYKEAVKGASFAKDGQGSWQITTTPTPSGPNKITLPATSKATSVKSSATKNTTKSQTNAAAADTLPSGSEDGNYNLDSNLSEAGTVAGATSQKHESGGLAILLIAAGISFLFAAAAWPAVEKRLWKKEP